MGERKEPLLPNRKKLKTSKFELAPNELVAEPQAAYSSREKNKIFDFIGIKGNKTESNSDIDLIQIIRIGLPNKVVSRLITMMDISEDEMSSILHVSTRTLKRRTPTKHLNPEQTERIVELAKLYAKGEEMMGNLEGFKDWMNKNIWILGGKKPKEFLDTSIGINLLMDELGRMQHGVYS